MFISTSNKNSENIILDAIAKIKNLNYILRFELLISIAQHINLRLIFYDIYINNPIIASNVKLNSYIFSCLNSYQLNLSLVFNSMLEVFCKKFYE